MRGVGLIVVVLPLVLLCGCDGGGSSSDTTVIISSGTLSVAAGTGEVASGFSIGEPGTVDVTVTWAGGPAELTVYVNSDGGATAGNVGSSPLVVSIIVSQAILDNTNTLSVGVLNNDATESAEVEYTVVFTPED